MLGIVRPCIYADFRDFLSPCQLGKCRLGRRLEPCVREVLLQDIVPAVCMCTTYSDLTLRLYVLIN